MALINCLQDGFEVEDLELQPTPHDCERVLHFLGQLLPVVKFLVLLDARLQLIEDHDAALVAIVTFGRAAISRSNLG